jgi:exodeoxyribonuclease V
MPKPAALRFDASQRVALDRILETLSDKSSQDFTLGGLAGSGKSSLLRKAVEDLGKLNRRIPVATFTGKAADVLRRKGIHHAQTLHSLIYDFDAETKTFHRVRKLEADGVIVDEASTVNKDLYFDLKSFKVPVVWVGDHGQLEPIGDNPNIMAKPDHVLERIYRQSRGSAILDVAHAFRQGLAPNWKSFVKQCEGHLATSCDAGCRFRGQEVARLSQKEAMERILDFDVVLCGLNQTRRNINDFIRRKQGRVMAIEPGETMVCLRNNRDHGVFNGMLLKVKRVHRSAGQDHILDLTDGMDRTLTSVRCRLMAGRDDANSLGTLSRDAIALDYGSCLSVHKSQGSEFGRVLVFEERGPWDMRKWRYTAASRASEFLAWTV